MNAFIVAARRTPFGTFGGSLKTTTATDLGVAASRAAIADLPADFVSKATDPSSKTQFFDSVIFGNVCQTSKDAAYLARHVGLRSGLPIEVPALTLNRLCGSGFQSIISAVQEMNSKDAKLALVGGTESMSQAPYVVRDIRFGTKFGAENLNLEDSLISALSDRYPKVIPMAITAEDLGDKYGITRQMADQYSLRSQVTWAKAHESGVFKHETTPIEIKSKKGTTLFEVDEHPRPKTTIEGLAGLRSVFKKDGLVTAGSASGICDGAAALVVASESACSEFNLSPLAKIVSYQVVGVDPTIMGIGPANAIRGALKKANLSLTDMDYIEINEAFAAQVLAVCRELELDPGRVNVHGGAIALGHPLAASGARIMTHLTHVLNQTKKRYAIGSACIGGGQGIAIIIENQNL
ncbi:hypothetical protein BB560_002983 [Smittium megazygosporum]|uniref:Thiolase N-terminal domain-containing protein n=1 Tax=Smittium megazygosporum TaxID=133381 RepID=A0A2T9ZDE1_9FUNG|nr:hypothetical protein BB560_002983 [Smittium megazygosporum]